MRNNKPVVGPITTASTEEKHGSICILARDGRLFGLFATRSRAIYWAESLGLDCYSTYDLLSPLKDPLGNNHE